MNYIPVPANTITLARAVNELIRQDRLIGNKLSTIGTGPTVSSVAGRTGDVVLTTADITSGTFLDARLSSNVPLKNVSNTFAANQYFGNVSLLSDSGNIYIDNSSTGDIILRTATGNKQLGKFTSGASTTTPGLAIYGTGTKAAGLFAGTTGAAFAYDNTGTFAIITENASAFTGNTVGTGTAVLSLTNAGVMTIANLAGTGTRRVDVSSTGVLSATVATSNIPLLDASNTFTTTQIFTNNIAQFQAGLSTSSNILNANFAVPSGLGAASATSSANLIFAGAANVSYRVTVRGSSTAAITAGNSYAHMIIGDNPIQEAGSGTHALIAGLVIKASTITGGVATVTNTANLYVESGFSATVTGDAYSIWSLGRARFDHVVCLPQFTTTNRDLISPLREGMMIMNTTTHEVNFYNGSAWRQITSTAG